MIKKLLTIFAILNLSCNGQIADYFFPELVKTTRSITDGITKHPIVTFATQTTGDILAAAVNTISQVSFAVSRTFELSIPFDLPTLVSNSNTVEVIDNVIADFNAGIGNEDAWMSIAQIISKYGYPLEQYDVETDDGYILALYRIPSNGSAVFLMHGLTGSADDYVIAGPGNGLAYLLADEGFDVWMGNARGNKHSRRHTNLSPSDAAFWDFSWHEIGVSDLPAMIDRILKKTKKRNLIYIGHSQGSTTFFVMASERPEYNKKISLMVALSPVAFMSNVRSPIVRLLAPGTPVIHTFLKSFGLYEFLPDDTIMRTLKLLMCGTGPLSEILCSNVMFLLTGFGYEQLNVTNLPVLYGHVPSGASAKQFAHYGQEVVSGEFRKFDYGTTENLKKYGKEVPPSYDLNKIVAPVSLFYSDADWLAHPTDVDELYNRLNNTVDIHKVACEQFNHIDFLWSKDFKLLIYTRLQKLLVLFENK